MKKLIMVSVLILSITLTCKKDNAVKIVKPEGVTVAAEKATPKADPPCIPCKVAKNVDPRSITYFGLVGGQINAENTAIDRAYTTFIQGVFACPTTSICKDNTNCLLPIARNAGFTVQAVPTPNTIPNTTYDVTVTLPRTISCDCFGIQ